MSGFGWQTRVYWEDTDGGGVVYYANYLKYLERARTEWLRQLGHAQGDLAREPGILFVVTGLNIEYRRPARLDDLLWVSCVARAAGAATLSFEQQIVRSGADATPLVVATVQVACVRAADLKPRRLPEFLREELQIA